MPKIVAYLSATIALILFSSQAMASSSTAGQIVALTGQSPGKIFFNQTGSRTSRPGCATTDRWVIDASTPAGQSLVALLLTAAAQNKQITVAGTDGCGDWADTESVNYFTIVN